MVVGAPLETIERQQFDLLAGHIAEHVNGHAPIVPQLAEFQPKFDIASLNNHIAPIMGHGATLFESHISGGLFHLIQLLQDHTTIQLVGYLRESSSFEHGRQPGTELLHRPADWAPSGRLVHIVPLVLVSRIVMVMRALVETVKTQ